MPEKDILQGQDDILDGLWSAHGLEIVEDTKISCERFELLSRDND